MKPRTESYFFAAAERYDLPHELAGPEQVWCSAYEAVEALIQALYARDAYTRAHSLRVATLSRALARQYGLPPVSCQEIYLAGLLHDIGKIGLPDTILLKVGPLNRDEFAIVRKHPEIGYRIVQGIAQLQFILPGILHHHERWDGLGYPHGLHESSTPLMARIIAVADALDAMTSSRSYRLARSVDSALATIAQGSGSQWDPDVVQSMKLWYNALEERKPSSRSRESAHAVTNHYDDALESIQKALLKLGNDQSDVSS